MASLEPVTMRWRLKTTASIRRTWSLLSDTDRFNRVAGKDDSFEERALPDGTVERVGTMRRLGIKLRWNEVPFEWNAPHAYSVRRVFQGGPASRYELRVRMRATDDNCTEIDYRVDVFPRRSLTRPAVLADAKLFTRPGLDRALNRAIEVLNGQRTLFDDPPPALDAASSERLTRGLADLRSAKVAKRLESYLRTAPLVSQQNLAPLRLARQWQLPEAETLVGFMDAVAGGVLSLSWELRCPSCRVSKGQEPRLRAGPQMVHCTSCNLPFDGSLPDNLVAGFSPDPRIRDIDIPLRCIGSPARTPHILAQHILIPGHTTEMHLSLLPGTYRLRTFPPTSNVSLQVRQDVVPRTASIQLRAAQLSPGILRLAPGKVTLRVVTLAQRGATLMIERVARTKDDLTAGRLLEFDDVRAAIPPDLLHPDLKIEAQRGVAVAVRVARGGATALSQLKRAMATWEPWSVTAQQDTLVALFRDGRRAVSAASLLDGAHHLGAGISAGMVLLRRDGETDEACGSVVERALMLADSGAGGSLIIGRQDACDTEMAAILASDGVTSEAVDDIDRGVVLHLSHPARTSPPLSIVQDRVRVAPGLLIDGRYRLNTRLGDGGFGTAWTAFDPDGAEVVIKLLHARLANDPIQVQRFFNEGRLVQGIDSRWVARVYDYGRGQGGHLYVAMERLHGEELWQRFKRDGPLSPALACAFAIDILRGLEDAHRAGLVHRDIKPANIFLCDAHERPEFEAPPDSRPTACIIDFGVARHMETVDPRLTLDGHAVGTPHYMSPEQVECGEIDGRTDIYSLACLLYECISGVLPFEGTNSLAILVARLREEPRPLRDVVKTDLPDRFMAVVMGALERDPNRRPSDATAFRVQLEAQMPALVDLVAAGRRTQELAMADTIDSTPTSHPK